jgi:colicin import membrane protein
MAAKRQAKIRSERSPMTIPLIKAMGVHIVLLLVLILSYQSHTAVEAIEIPINQPNPIKARAVSSAEVERLVQQKQDKENAAKRAAEEKARRIKAEEDRKRKAAADKKRKAAAERKRKADAERKRKAEEQRKREEAERKKREDAEQKRKEEAERKKREAEQRRQAEIAAQQRAAAEQRAMSELQKYTALIKNKVSRNWIQGNQKGQCVLEVRLASSGLILDVRELSGEPGICRSAKAAVYKSDPLPVSTDPAVFAKMRVLRLDLDPEDN